MGPKSGLLPVLWDEWVPGGFGQDAEMLVVDFITTHVVSRFFYFLGLISNLEKLMKYPGPQLHYWIIIRETSNINSHISSQTFCDNFYWANANNDPVLILYPPAT